LGQLHGRAGHVRGETLELLFELLEKGHGVGGGTGEAGEDFPAAHRAHLLRMGLHDRVADGYLAVAAKGDLVAAADRENGGGVDRGQLSHRPESTAPAGTPSPESR